MIVGDRFNPFRSFNGIMIPESMVPYRKVSNGSKLTYGRLMRYAGKDGSCFPAMATLAKELGVVERTAQAYISELETEGFISRESRFINGAQTANRYIFHWHRIFDADDEDDYGVGERAPGGGDMDSPRAPITAPQLRESVLRESVKESHNTLPTLSEKPSEEKPSEEKQEESSCPTLDNFELDLTSPIEEFARNSLRNIARVKPPNLKTRASQRTVELLRLGEEQHGSAPYRMALVKWCQGNHFWEPWLRENKFPLEHFFKLVDKFLPDEYVAPRRAPNPPRPAVAAPLPVPTVLHVPLSEAVKRVTPAEMVATWNQIVTAKPFSGGNPDAVFDPDFTASTWEKVCETAKAIIEAKGKEASWLTLRWVLRSDPAKGQNWRRMAEGEFDFMTTGAMAKPMTRGQKDAKLAQDFIAELKAKSAAKKAQEKTNAVERQTESS